MILAAGTLGLVLLRLAGTFRENAQLLALTRAEAITDRAHGPRERRRLVRPRRALADAHTRAAILMIFIYGFKGYNDSFGHPGTPLLARLAAKLATVPCEAGAPTGSGERFCLVTPIVEGETEG